MATNDDKTGAEPSASLMSGPASDHLILDYGAGPAARPEEAVVLSLADLLPDAAGEVVLFAGDDVPVSLLTHETLTAAGIAPEHVTAAGLEVAGLHYYSFASGVTVYSPTDLVIAPEPELG